MNEEIRERWVRALKSGEYKQGYGRLRIGNKYCCLGVLCDLAARDGIVNAHEEDGYIAGEFSYDGSRFALPAAVVKWAGLREQDPFMNRAQNNLGTLNDTGWSFRTIAQHIKEEL
jgi:hypothetical protein